MSCCPKYYAPQRLFECCNDTNCFNIEVKPGQEGTLSVFDAPDTFCFTVEHIIHDKCCKNPSYFCVEAPCGCCHLSLSCGESHSGLKTGHYRICVVDCDGEPVVPDSGEVVMQFIQTPI